MRMIIIKGLALYFFTTLIPVSAKSLVGEWIPITGNKYRNISVKTEKEFDCFRGTRLHFDSEGTHVIEQKKHTCEKDGKLTHVSPYIDKYWFDIELKGDYSLLSYALIDGGENYEIWLNYVFFVNEDVFFIVQQPEWREDEEKRWYYKRVKQ